MKTRHAFVLALLPFATSSPAFADTFTTLNYPGANWTKITSVSGSTVVGNYSSSNGSHAFIHDGSTFNTLDVPGFPGLQPTGVSGSTVVGNYADSTNHGFISNGSTVKMLDFPGAVNTYVQGISGNTVAGYYVNSDYGTHGFTYNGSTFTTLDAPGATSTEILDIYGDTVAGFYDSTHAFTYDGSHFTTWEVPVVPAAYYATDTITGVSGHTVVGYFQPSAAIQFSGFVYDGSHFTTVEYPGAFSTFIYGISGDTVFGTGTTYGLIDEDIVAYGPGFITQVPEPASAIPFGIAGLVLLVRRRKARWCAF